MTTRPRLLPALLAAALALVAAAGCGTGGGSDASPSAPTGSITVEGATIDWPPNPETALVRFAIDNGSATEDHLVAVASPVGDATIHRSDVDEAGTATMSPVDRVTIAPRSSVQFAPGGLHVMLTGITTDLQIGDEVPVTLTLEGAGEVSFEATVVEPGSVGDDTADPGGAHDHG